MITAECTKTYQAGAHRVVEGTQAKVIGATITPTPSVTLKFDGFRLDVPVRELDLHWRTKIG